MTDHPISPAGHDCRPMAAKGAEHLGLSPRTSAMAHHSAILFTSQPTAPSSRASFIKNSNDVAWPGWNRL